MKIPFYQVDAFTDVVFGGNPAGVCIFDSFDDVSDETLLNIAQENNLAETAYIVEKDPQNWELRWFTPDLEMDLCGHATLASAHVVFAHVIKDHKMEKISFHTRYSGILEISRATEGRGYTMSLPSRPGKQVPSEDIPAAITRSIGPEINILDAHKSRDYMIVLESEAVVANLDGEFNHCPAIPSAGVVRAVVLADASAPGMHEADGHLLLI